jgi:hypothetical protein
VNATNNESDNTTAAPEADTQSDLSVTASSCFDLE